MIDCGTRWGNDPGLAASVNYRIECAISRACDAITLTDDNGKPAVITWKIE